MTGTPCADFGLGINEYWCEPSVVSTQGGTFYQCVGTTLQKVVDRQAMGLCSPVFCPGGSINTTVPACAGQGQFFACLCVEDTTPAACEDLGCHGAGTEVSLCYEGQKATAVCPNTCADQGSFIECN